MQKIIINTLKTIGKVDDNIFGNFIENLGTCIYGGVYDPGSPAADEEGFRKDVMEASRKMGITQVRFPGGCFAPQYRFKEGIGPRELRPKSNQTPEGFSPNGFGTDEFISWCRKIHAEPYICINMGSGNAEEARDWVDYCNGVGGTEWSDRRIANGHPEPYKVKYWAIGNEISASYEYGYTETPELYIEKARPFIQMMKACDPTIRITLAGCIFPLGAGRMTPYAYDWNYKVLKEFFEEADYISMHHYIGTVGKSRFLRELRKEMSEVEFHLGMHEYMQEVADSYEIIKSDILHVCSDKKKIRKIGIALDEYNPWYNTLPEPKLMHMYNISDALLVGRYFNLFIQKADVATISNMAQLVNVLPAVVTKSGESGFFRQGISYIPEMYLGNQGNIAVDVFLESESYPGKYYRDAKYVDSSASLSPDGDFVTLNLINIHPEKSFDYEVIVPGKEIASIEGSCLSEMDLAAYNTFEDPDRLKIQRIQAFEGNQIQIPAMACMVLKLRLK